jgi:uncharacterized protein (UPF0276 family)
MAIVESLGVGFPYVSTLPPAFYRSGEIDFVEVTPEALCRPSDDGAGMELRLVPERVERARATCHDLPVVVHGAEPSIGSVHACNDAYLELLDGLHRRWPFRWHSEHLGLRAPPGDSHLSEVDVRLPLPATYEAAELVAEHSAGIGERYGVPFLLENPAYYLSTALPAADPGLHDDIDLLSTIMTLSGCHQLLDLHTIYCNALTRQVDPRALLARVPLGRVIEIHVAGEATRAGFRTGDLNARVPDAVWQLLEYVLPRAPNAAGIVVEIPEHFAPRLGTAAIRAELARARAIWNRHRG